MFREIISCFIAEGHCIAYPGSNFLALCAGVDYDHDKRQKDAHALDCRIRAAIETDDLIEEWARDLGKQVRTDIRRQGAKLQGALRWLQDKHEDGDTELQDKDEGPFRTACGKFGIPIATAARDIIRFTRDRVKSVSESGGAAGPPDGQADTEGPIRPDDLAKARPRPPPPPRRPDVQDDRAHDEVTESPCSAS
eukprot:5514612-Pyramimonas_sp.AAC.1